MKVYILIWSFFIANVAICQIDSEYKKAYKSLSDGELYSAGLEFEAIYKKDSTQYEAMKEHANILFDLEEYNLAIALYLKIIEKEPGFYPAYYNLGSAYNETKNDIEAIKMYTKALNIKGFDADIYFNRALSYAVLEDYKNALSDYVAILNVFPDNIEVLYHAAEIEETNGLYSNASNYYTKILSIDSTQNDARYLRTFADTTTREKTLAYFSTIIEQNKSDETIYFYRAALNYALGYLDKSLSDVNFLLNKDYNNVEYLYTRASIYQELKDSANAILDYTHLYKLDHEDLNALYYRGLCYKSLRKLDEAFLDFSKVIIEYPEYLDAYFARGETLLLLKKYGQAQFDYEAILKIDPQNGRAVYQIGVAYSQQKKMKIACENWHKALAMGYIPAQKTINNWCK